MAWPFCPKFSRKRNREQKTARQGRHNQNCYFTNGSGDKDQIEPSFNCLISSVFFLAKKANDWYADSGATHHMTDQRHFFYNTHTREAKDMLCSWYWLDQNGRPWNWQHQYILLCQRRKENRKIDWRALRTWNLSNLFSLGTAMDLDIKADFDGDMAFFQDKKRD